MNFIEITGLYLSSPLAIAWESRSVHRRVAGGKRGESKVKLLCWPHGGSNTFASALTQGGFHLVAAVDRFNPTIVPQWIAALGG